MFEENREEDMLVTDCAQCRNSCVNFPHQHLHKDGTPFCVVGMEVEIEGSVETEQLQLGIMKPAVVPCPKQRTEMVERGR